MMNEQFLKDVNEFVYQYPASWDSGFRTPARNRIVGGAEHSQHLQGKAIDLIYDSVAELWQAGKAATQKRNSDGVLIFGGVEIDLTNNHLHLDQRAIIWHVVCYWEGKKRKTMTIDQYLTMFPEATKV